jgi:DNA uptake protein ComE-like DNA-binding protein
MNTRRCKVGNRRGSALVIVLWLCLGLVSVALYFAHSMSLEMRVADNRVAAIQAGEVILGGARYASNVLANLQTPGLMPDEKTYQRERVAVGEGAFWYIGRREDQTGVDAPWFGFVDEASKINLNTATAAMLQALPRMTPELAAAIIDWRDADSIVSDGGAEDETYQRLNPPYRCKNGPFESVDELRLVYGMDLDMLYGNDANLNGTLDANENDGDETPPNDDRSGVLAPGLLEYVTVWSQETTAGRTNVNNPQQLRAVLTSAFGANRANQILLQLGGNPALPPPQIPNLVEFYLTSRMTRGELDQVADQIVATTNTSGTITGLININTASEAVLECIPGIGTQYASSVTSYRLSHPDALQSVAWLVELIGSEAARQSGPWITTQTHQFSVDVAALGRHNRGYRRARFIFDTSDGTPRIVWREDLTHLGWALGKATRTDIESADRTQ